ncbi:AtpZ/AtpI family protein [Paenibacillus kandeliae]|uniref:AtpZ/AtpI family protein n=1 Tax=Paenibacillus kandeliae TaxID=3231269 RepID=UPI00345A2D93
MTGQQQRKPDGSSPWKAVGLVSAIGIDLTVCTLAGFWFGSWLDRMWNGSGIGIAIGVLAGLFAGIVGIIVIIKKIVGEPNE